MINFQQYDKDNPQIWQAFVHYTVMTKKKGFSRYSAKSIFELIRWHTGVKANDEQFKVNNNFTADYARKMMKTFPEYEGFFETRNLRQLRVCK